MRAVLLLLIASVLHCTCPAQQCFFVDSIRSIPAIPTNEDVVTLELYGDLIGARTRILAASATREDQRIFIHLDVSCDSNTALVLPHRERLQIGALPVGRYHIQLEGSGASMMDSSITLLVVPYAGRYQSSAAPPEMMHFDALSDVFIIDIDPALYVVRVRIYDTDAKLQREAFIDGSGLTHISTTDLPEGNYLILVDLDTGNITRWASIRRKR